MAEEFSAQYYLDMTPDEFAAEAEDHKIDIHGKHRNEAVDAVYNAELQRRQDAIQKKLADDAKKPKAPVRVARHEEDEQTAVTDAHDYAEMTVADLRAEANTRGLTLPAKATKADLIAALEDNDDNQPEIDAGHGITKG